jgi:hypothetical protein
MSKDSLSFYDYIHFHSSDNINTFKQCFQDRLHNIPQHVVSSKIIMHNLNIISNYEFLIFQGAFFEYYKKRMTF